MNAEEQLPDLIERETKLPRSLDDCQAVQHGRVVTSLSTHSSRRGEQSDLFVVADCGWLNPNLTRYL
jgi:hypothetical protein